MSNNGRTAEDDTGAGSYLTPSKLIWGRFRRHPLALAGMVLLGVMVLLNILAAFLDPLIKRSLGQSIWANPIYREPSVLVIGFSSGLLAMLLGTALGTIGGYFRGWIDRALRWLADVLLAFPALPLMIALASIVLAERGARENTSFIMVFSIAALGFLFTPVIARVARSYYLYFQAQEFTEAARAVGASDVRMIFWYILPNALGPIMVSTIFIVAGCITLEATLDFFGFGASFPGGGTPTWGNLMVSGQNSPLLEARVWLLVFPGLLLLLTVLAINCIGAGLRAALRSHATGAAPERVG